MRLAEKVNWADWEKWFDDGLAETIATSAG
jgi:hypothetical protein